MRYENGKWNEIEVQDQLKVTKLQAQVCLCFCLCMFLLWQVNTLVMFIACV